MAQKAYRLELDGVRAFCIIFTILNHIPGKPWFINGSVGVDVFFALSGWLITSLLLTEGKERGTIDILAFYIRRLFRILPLYYITIAFYGVAVLATGLSHAGKLQEFKSALLYLLTLNSEYRSPEAGNLFGHAWTLGIEEKFYILWPAILFFLARKPWVALAIALPVFFSLVAVAPDYDQLIRGYWGLAIGTALAVGAGRSLKIVACLHDMPIANYSVSVIGLAYAFSLFHLGGVVCNLMIAAAAAALVASLWFNEAQLVSRFLRFAPFVWVGRFTYAIYLIQTLATNCVETLLNALQLPHNWIVIFIGSYALSIGIAWMLHVAVESPCIRFGRNLSRRQKAPLLA